MSYANRNEIPEKYKWNLCDIFATPQDWDKAFVEMSQEYKKLTAFQGKLGNRDSLLEFLKLSDRIDLKLERLFGYAHLDYDTDVQDPVRQARYAKVYSLFTEYSEALAFVSPEISSLPDEQLQAFINDPAFSDYDVQLANILRGKSHILSQAEEKLLAGVGAFSGQFHEVFNRLDSGDIKFDKITVDGKEVQLGHGTYSMCLQHKDQAVRKLAFETYYKAYIEKINTLAGLYEGSVKADCYF